MDLSVEGYCREQPQRRLTHPASLAKVRPAKLNYPTTDPRSTSDDPSVQIDRDGIRYNVKFDLLIYMYYGSYIIYITAACRAYVSAYVYAGRTDIFFQFVIARILVKCKKILFSVTHLMLDVVVALVTVGLLLIKIILNYNWVAM